MGIPIPGMMGAQPPPQTPGASQPSQADANPLVHYFVQLGINPVTAVQMAGKIGVMTPPPEPIANGVRLNPPMAAMKESTRRFMHNPMVSTALQAAQGKLQAMTDGAKMYEGRGIDIAVGRPTPTGKVGQFTGQGINMDTSKPYADAISSADPQGDSALRRAAGPLPSMQTKYIKNQKNPYEEVQKKWLQEHTDAISGVGAPQLDWHAVPDEEENK